MNLPHPAQTALRSTFALLLAAGSVFASATVEAQYSDELRSRSRRSTPEHFGLELKIGTYNPGARVADGTSAVEAIFGDDHGPLLQLEFDVFAYRIPFVGLIGGAVSGGWARYSAVLCLDAACTQRLDEEGQLKLFPVALMAVLRVDVLARELNVPLVVTGKVGLDAIFFKSSGGTAGSGSSFGVRWAVQFALELDFLDRRRAAMLDQEWGINHSALFVEIFGSTADSTVDLGTSLAWTIGLGITF